MKEYLQRILNFLAENDFQKLLESVRGLNWIDVVQSLYFWLIGVPIIIALLWRKKTKTLVALVTAVLFVILIQYTLGAPGEQMPLKDLLAFFGGAVALIGIYLYFLFIRD
ncbi:MAG: hypothetical protein LLG06_06335 [Desulfobacteraceae bacterium]|nr:hypothetical protein [Desulfobacteraceae bacterium]